MLSGLVAVLDENGTVIETRDLGPTPVAVKPGRVLPLVEDKPELGTDQTYGTPTYEVGPDQVIAHYPVVAIRRTVAKSLIITRLNEAGKLAAARQALNADIYRRERWYAPDKPDVFADDPEALALLAAIGADPAIIMAP